jgi:mono/diheme cytochrome c family protein
MLSRHAIVLPAISVTLLAAPVHRDGGSVGSLGQEPGTAVTTAGGSYTEAQAIRGKALYLERCASCHGEDFVPDEFATGLTGAAFDWRWKDRTVFDLYEAIRTTMPPDDVGSLGPQTTVDIVAYLLQVNAYKSGKTELPPKPDTLRQMRLKR